MKGRRTQVRILALRLISLSLNVAVCGHLSGDLALDKERTAKGLIPLPISMQIHSGGDSHSDHAMRRFSL